MPKVLVKGGDYTVDEIVGREFAGKTVVLPFVEGYSTTNMIKNLRRNVCVKWIEGYAGWWTMELDDHCASN